MSNLQSNNISFDPQPGVNLVIGKNGSGKTSLLNQLFDVNYNLRKIIRIYGDSCLFIKSVFLSGFSGDKEKVKNWLDEINSSEDVLDHKVGKGLSIALNAIDMINNRAKENSLILYDNFGAEFDPSTVRMILYIIRTIADEKNLTIVLASNSSTVINEFEDYKDFIYVVSRNTNQVQKLLDIVDKNYISHFSLGDLFNRERLFL